MTDTAAIWITAAITAVTTLGAVLVSGWVAHRSRTSHHDREMRANAYAEVLRRSVDAHSRFSAAWSTKDLIDFGWSGWNEAVALVALVATKPVADAANEMDELYWVYARPDGRDDTSWYAGSKRLEDVGVDFVNACRLELQGTKVKLERVGGRPPADDPIWGGAEA